MTAASPTPLARAPEIIAHRGARATHPENTLAAFAEAARLRSDGIEFDVQLSADGVPVVIHDADVHRTTGVSGKVGGLTAHELTALDAGAWVAPRFAGERIPTLDAVLEWGAEQRLTLHIELKGGPGTPMPELSAAVVAAVERHGMVERVVLSSYDHRGLVFARERCAPLATAVLFDFGLYRPWVYAADVGAQALHCRWDWIDRELVEQASAHGIAVRGFGAETESAVGAVLGAGASVITPRPERARALRHAPPRRAAEG
ncbi:glycerophosphodiester phosphodiesterase [Egibacter rhizosphaerae]|uniref:glycerophosphodiester phosphodiesterase n=1 Tax=Egibacter rhizosphaerae TaxID=1670831 RepID=UPI0013F169CF|nr:glycerophosphodiester phosphodiesterase family protein [Egibacter rhizosphaerae]